MRFDRPSFGDSSGEKPDKPDKDKPSDWFPSKSVSGSELAKRMDRLINEEIAAETGEDVAVVEARFKTADGRTQS